MTTPGRAAGAPPPLPGLGGGTAHGRTGVTAMTVKLARAAGHQVIMFDKLDDPVAARAAASGFDGRPVDGVILVPPPGDAERNTHQATRVLMNAAADVAPEAHLVLVTSFIVGHGEAHGLNRVSGTLPARERAEAALRDGPLAWTIVRPTWLTNDPPGHHAITLTSDPETDGMIARADVAVTCLAALAEPASRGQTFALFNEPGPAPRSWRTAFTDLARDGVAQA